MGLIYHMAREAEWAAAAGGNLYHGAAEDRADGFIHFSTGEQVRESAARHRAGETGLVLVACDPAKLGSALRWEPARDGSLFPHLYGPVPLEAVVWSRPLPLGEDGLHRFPETLG